MKHPKPEPVIVTTLCSLCNEDWAAHGDDPSTVDCIRLLRAKIARMPHTTIINTPYVVPRPYTWPSYPQWTYASGCTTTGTTAINSSISYMTPRNEGPEPIGVAA